MDDSSDQVQSRLITPRGGDATCGNNQLKQACGSNRLAATAGRGRKTFAGSILIAEQATLLVRPRLLLVVAALRRRRIGAAIALVIFLLRIGLRAVDAAARRRIALLGGAAVGGINIAVIGTSLRIGGLRVAALPLGRDHDGV